jgi:hypothetical protein
MDGEEPLTKRKWRKQMRAGKILYTTTLYQSGTLHKQVVRGSYIGVLKATLKLLESMRKQILNEYRLPGGVPLLDAEYEDAETKEERLKFLSDYQNAAWVSCYDDLEENDELEIWQGEPDIMPGYFCIITVDTADLHLRDLLNSPTDLTPILNRKEGEKLTDVIAKWGKKNP